MVGSSVMRLLIVTDSQVVIKQAFETSWGSSQRRFVMPCDSESINWINSCARIGLER